MPNSSFPIERRSRFGQGIQRRIPAFAGMTEKLFIRYKNYVFGAAFGDFVIPKYLLHLARHPGLKARFYHDNKLATVIQPIVRLDYHTIHHFAATVGGRVGDNNIKFSFAELTIAVAGEYSHIDELIELYIGFGCGYGGDVAIYGSNLGLRISFAGPERNGAPAATPVEYLNSVILRLGRRNSEILRFAQDDARQDMQKQPRTLVESLGRKQVGLGIEYYFGAGNFKTVH